MKRFKKIYLEITNACNLKCHFCPETKRKTEFMSKATFAYILSQIKPFTDHIYLHVKGEPLLHPGLGDFLDISYKEGLKVNITTNGTLLYKAADILIEKPAVRQINFSLHSFDGNQQAALKDSYIESILTFCSRALKDSNKIISLRLWNLDSALLSVDQRKRNVDILQAIEEKFSLPYQIQSLLSKAKGLKVQDRLYVNQDYEFTWPDLKSQEDLAKGTCYGLRDQVAILSNGTVVPCCLDGEGVINLGSIHEREFSDIITAHRAEKIRNEFGNNNIVEELCRKCGFRKRFNISHDGLAC